MSANCELQNPPSDICNSHSSPTILVTGGAGYIGSHTVKLLLQRGYQPVVIDDLRYGHRQAVLGGHFVEGTLHDTARLEEVLRTHDISAVIHFAAFAYVGESVRDPLVYYYNNVGGTVSLLQAMQAVGVRRLIFSSTCATYGIPSSLSSPKRIHKTQSILMVKASSSSSGYYTLAPRRMTCGGSACATSTRLVLTPMVN